MDGPGVPTPANGYAATFIFRIPEEARGAYVIDLLHDTRDPAQRTFLFSTTEGAAIELDATTPAVVQVQPRESKRRELRGD